MNKLKPCPFCGHPVRVRSYQEEKTDWKIETHIECESEGCLGANVRFASEWGEDPDLFIGKWNNRKAPLPCPACEAAARERDAAYEDARQMQERLQRLINANPNVEAHLDRIDLLEKQLRAVRAQVETVRRDKAAAAGAAKREIADLRARIADLHAQNIELHERRIADLRRRRPRVEGRAHSIRCAGYQGVDAPFNDAYCDCGAIYNQLADLRARLEALCDHYDGTTGWADEKPLIMGDLIDELRDLLRKEAK